ncbi:hypothetical protein SAMD00019534_114220 [Acytostelium subglobosum LB1]|uniref:hypothetical protein n=1 Tax=Acytostelium subglobosum LB1 TaxID=1410327 RepID=UPI000644D44A|nr:hypothetical protein SAMD00019534_114220 [Acytostelium subglobosum LB1]GAM28246.1 hypothetical protein SAMD00019534_114220 [Acytostelium subglobosum LB1]|eukprot:XP_012748880.1 hypothetical protein SAMD00019534_114220 [Acytostelium subglobosum LB1]
MFESLYNGIMKSNESLSLQSIGCSSFSTYNPFKDVMPSAHKTYHVDLTVETMRDYTIAEQEDQQLQQLLTSHLVRLHIVLDDNNNNIDVGTIELQEFYDNAINLRSLTLSIPNIAMINDIDITIASYIKGELQQNITKIGTTLHHLQQDIFKHVEHIRIHMIQGGVIIPFSRRLLSTITTMLGTCVVMN